MLRAPALRRRAAQHVLALASVLPFTVGLAGCRPEPSTTTPEVVPTSGPSITGRVELDGQPASGMTVRTGGGATFMPYAETHSDGEGRFVLPVDGPRHIRLSLAPEGVQRSVASIDFWADGDETVVARELAGRWTFELSGAEAWPVTEAEEAAAAFDEQLMRRTGYGLRVQEPKSETEAFAAAVGEQWTALLRAPGESERALTAIIVAGALVERLGPEPFAALTTMIEPEDPRWAAMSPAVTVLQPLWATPAGRDYFARMKAAHDDPSLAGALLYVELVEADRAGDDAIARARYDALREPRFAKVIWPTFAAGMDPDRPLRPGRPIPAFEYEALGGGTIDRASLRGKPYLLEIWATWCSGCMALMPAMHRLYAEFNGLTPPEDLRASTAAEDPWLQFVSLSIDASADEAARFRDREWPMPWLVAWGEDEAVQQTFRFAGTPTLVLVSAEGTIVAVDHHPSPALLEAIESLRPPAGDADAPRPSP